MTLATRSPLYTSCRRVPLWSNHAPTHMSRWDRESTGPSSPPAWHSMQQGHRTSCLFGTVCEFLISCEHFPCHGFSGKTNLRSGLLSGRLSCPPGPPMLSGLVLRGNSATLRLCWARWGEKGNRERFCSTSNLVLVGGKATMRRRTMAADNMAMICATN